MKQKQAGCRKQKTLKGGGLAGLDTPQSLIITVGLVGEKMTESSCKRGKIEAGGD